MDRKLYLDFKKVSFYVIKTNQQRVNDAFEIVFKIHYSNIKGIIVVKQDKK